MECIGKSGNNIILQITEKYVTLHIIKKRTFKIKKKQKELKQKGGILVMKLNNVK